MKTHGSCTPHAQWDHGPLLTGRATQAIDPHQAFRVSKLSDVGLRRYDFIVSQSRFSDALRFSFFFSVAR
jgi:hypothetical protein